MAYDIFISFKKTDNGNLTEDYYLAKELKKILDSLNYKVFFSEDEIPNNKESRFGKIIAQALDEAKILIYVCTNPEYLNSSYVFYEWDSFHNEIICGRKDGEIYGVVKGLRPQNLPFGLRQYDMYNFETEIDKLLSSIKAYFKECDTVFKTCSIEEFNINQFQKYAKYNTDDYISESFNEFVSLVQGEQNSLAVISYNKNTDAYTAVYSKAKQMVTNGDDIIYLDKLSEMNEVYTSLSEQNHYIVFINNIASITEMAQVFEYIEKNNNLRFIVGVNSYDSEILTTIEGQALIYKFNILNEAESQSYLEFLSKKYNISLSSQLLSILLLPTLKEFRTPKMLKVILMNLKKLENYLDYDYNMTDIFEIIDDYIVKVDEKLSNVMQKLITKAMKKGLNKFSLVDVEEFRDSLDRLIDLGIVCRQGSYYSISSKEYYNYKIAQTYFDENGINYSAESFAHFKESLPYYIYLYYLSVGELIIDSFELNTCDIASLLQLFVSEEKFEEIVISHKYDNEVLQFLKHARRTGLYSMAMRIIEIFEANGISSSEEFDYLSEKIYLKFALEGKLLETSETHGNIYYRTAYCYYCLDDYENSLKYFALAYEKMLNSDFIDYSLLFHYIELSLDVGNNELTKELLEIYETNIGSSTKFIGEYFYTKAMMALDNLEFSLAIDYLNSCVENCNKDVNIRRLQIYYGELGRAYYYLANYEESKKYFQRNLYIAQTLDDYHGMGISTKMLGKIYFNLKEFEECYKYLSYAENYAQKIGNYWRWGKIILLLNILLKNNDSLDKADEIIELIKSNVFRYDAYYLYSQLYYVKSDLENAKKYASMANFSTLEMNNKRAFEITKAWLEYLDGKNVEISINHKNYFIDTINALNELKDNNHELQQKIPYYKFEELNTERLYLRMVKVADAASIFEYTSDFSNTKYVLWKTHKNLNDSYKYIESIHSLENIGYSMTWGICLKDENKFIGTIDLAYNEKYEAIEIGYILNKKYWRNGYAKEAIINIVDFAKNVLGLDKLIGVAFKVNEASNNLLKKCGFVFVKEIPNYHSKPLIIDKSGMYYELLLK